MLCILNIICEKLAGLLLFFWTTLCSYLTFNFTNGNNFNENFGNFKKNSVHFIDKQINNSENSLSTVSSLIFPSSKSSSKTSSENRDSPLMYPTYFIDEIMSDLSESQSNCNLGVNNLKKINSRIKRNKSSASKLNLYFKKDNPNILLNKNNESIIKNQNKKFVDDAILIQEQITKSVICRKCFKPISQYFTKAYYRYQDNSICYDCYNNLKIDLTTPKK